MLTAPILLALAGLVANAQLMKVKETHVVPRDWTRLDDSPADQPLRLSIALRQSRFDELEKHLFEVSDPNHPRYGQHLSQEHVNSLIRPAQQTSDLVHEWLESHNISAADEATYSPANDWITVTIPISKVEQMLNTKYSTYRHADGSQLIRTHEWSLPDFLHDHITAIQPTTSFFRAKPRAVAFKPTQDHSLWSHPNGPWGNWGNKPGPFPDPAWTHHGKPPDVSAVCNSSLVTPLCLRTLYGTINYVPQAAGRNKVGLVNYLGENNNRSDVEIFLQTYRPDAVSAAQSFTQISINGGSIQQTPDTPEQLEDGTDLEANLDAETIIGITYPTPLTTYSVGGMPPFTPDLVTPTDTNEPYLDWLNYVLAQPDSVIPQVISTSYGDDEQTVPRSYAVTVCQQFAQLGARGVSLLFASGDDGVGTTGKCYTNDGRNTSTFLPSFPDGCPYVTSVGATYKFNPEVAANDVAHNGFASGGGFSNYFAQPSYQSSAVSAYLAQLGSTYAGLYNASGRAYPDLAAQGQRYATIWNGSLAVLDGTSASTPAMAAVLSLVNDALISKGQAPLGFLNPWLYKGGYRAFTDVTSGSAIGCGVKGAPLTGFEAVKGWDPVTGWGTPRFWDIVENVLVSRGKFGGHGGYGHAGHPRE